MGCGWKTRVIKTEEVWQGKLLTKWESKGTLMVGVSLLLCGGGLLKGF